MGRGVRAKVGSRADRRAAARLFVVRQWPSAQTGKFACARARANRPDVQIEAQARRAG